MEGYVYFSFTEGPVGKRRSSVGKRKSKSPAKARREELGQSKVLTPSSKPPQPIFSDDIENQSPESVASSSTRRVSRRRSSLKRDAKILTPKVKLWSLNCFLLV